jgi:AraC family transcriptional regulator
MAQAATFRANETHGRVLRPGNRLVLHSQDVGWSPLHAAVFEESPLTVDESPIGHPSLIYHLSHPTFVARRVQDQRPERTLIGPRRFCLTPGEAATHWEHNGQPEILQIYLRQSTYESALMELTGCDERLAEIMPRFAFTDPLLEQLALAIVGALREGVSEDQLYIDSIAQMIAAHLVRKYSTRARPEIVQSADGLTSLRIKRLVDFIEANLDGDLSLEAIAAQVEISSLYLSRYFKSALGMAPHQYVVGRRIEKAKRLLRDTDVSVADIAFACGFSSQSHLSNRFRKIVGVSPAAYRR